MCVLVGLLGLISCKSNKNVVVDNTEQKVETKGTIQTDLGEKLLTFSKSGCYGRCPVYSIDIFDKGVAQYTGRSYTDKEGLWQKTLTKGQMSLVLVGIRTADFPNLDVEYKSMIPDLPRTTFEYFGGEEPKTVTGKETLPEQIKELKDLMEDLGQMQGWIKLSDEVKEGKVELNYDEIIVKFKPGVGLPGWFKKMASEGVYLKRRVAPESDLWVAGYKRSSTRPEYILKLIQDDPGIESAEFNKKASNR